MGFFDKKSTVKQTTNDYTTTNTVGATDQRAAGDNSVIGGSVTAQSISGDVSFSDLGAIEKSFDFATGAIDGATNIAANSFQYADNAVTNSLLFGKSALDSNREAMGVVKEITGDAFDTVFKNSAAALTFATDSQENALGSLDKATNSLSSVASNAISAISSVVKGANTSDSVQTIQYIVGGVIAVALVFIFLKAPKGN